MSATLRLRVISVSKVPPSAHLSDIIVPAFVPNANTIKLRGTKVGLRRCPHGHDQNRVTMTEDFSSDRGCALIVEDEFLIALDLEETMQALGFEVCALAPTAKEAISLAMRNPPDVVLMDVYLDGTRQGIEAA